MTQMHEKHTEKVWLLLLLGITAAGAALRLVWLSGAPAALHFDEAVYGLMARNIGRGNWPVFFHAYTGREPLYMYLMAGVFRIFGSTAVTLRLTSALIGIATIPLVFVLFRELFSTRVGLLAAAVAAFNYWHLSISRNGYPNVLIPPIECLALLFLWKGYRDKRLIPMALGGAFVGLVLYTYLAARLFPVTLVLYFAYLLLIEPRRVWGRLGGLVLAAASAGLVFWPLGYHYYRNPADFYERASQVLVFETQAEWWQAAIVMGGNLLQNLRGLVWRGDPRWLFNLPGKPALTLLLAPFFLLGVAFALRNWRRAEYALLPIWIVGMSLPAVLTVDAMPQSQRISGLTPALFALTALGLDRAYAWLEARQLARWRMLPVLAMVVVFAFEGIHTGYTYFGVWAQEPLNFYHFHGPYELLAKHARDHLQQGDTIVVISEHYQHPTSLYETPAMRRAIWLVADKTVVIPHREEGEIIYYWPLDPYRDQPFIERMMPELAEPTETLYDPQGEPAVRVFRSRSDAASGVVGETAAAMGEIDVLDWEVPARARRDEPLQVLVRWRASERTTQGRTFSVHLVDEQGHRWTQETDLGFMPEQWRTGDIVYHSFELPLPPGIPAGRYSVRFLVDDEQSAPFVVLRHGAPSGFFLELGFVELTAAGPTVAPPGRGVDFGDALRLTQHSQFAEAQVEMPTLTIESTWQALDPGQDHDAVIALRDDSGVVVYEALYPLAYQFPTGQWVAREVVRARYIVDLPELPAGRYQVELGVAGYGGAVSLGTVHLSDSLRRFDVPPMEHAVDAHVAEKIALLGYDLDDTVVPTGTLRFTLYWQAREAPDIDAKVFVHLVDDQGQIRAQEDRVPANWQRPTSVWRSGEVVSDSYEIGLPEGLLPGDYAVYVGMYAEQSLVRLPVLDSAGQRVEDDRLLLTTVTVSGS